jgi:Ulp1 family protease
LPYKVYIYTKPCKIGIEIFIEDLDRLNPGQWFNDNIIEFWLLWLMRNENIETTDVLKVSSYFYSTLIDKGKNAVDQWLIHEDVFGKKKIGSNQL